MCWSWEVSLAFVIFQAVSLSYLSWRNKYIDRWYVLVCLPFMGQEICQFFQWAFGDIETATQNECNSFNETWSKILICVAYAIPLVVSIFAFQTSQYLPKEKNKKLAFLWKYLLIFDVIMYPILCILMMIDKECVTVGENGHQHWPPLLSPKIVEDAISWGEYILIGSYYYPSIVLVGIFYQPLWIAFLPAIYSIISIVLLLCISGSEGWSIWCWSCAIITVWVFIYVPISQYMIKQYRNDHGKHIIDNLFGHNCLVEIFLRKTHAHFCRFGMFANDAESGMVELQRKNSKVVIVGAGPAGIHMYSLLHKAGWNAKNITILEKANRIGGKAYTIQDKGTGVNDHFGFVHEMGTCYAHPDYHAIFELIKEYDPDNEMKGVPSRGVFETNMTEPDTDTRIQKHVCFSDWLLADSEELGVPDKYHWISDGITGGISFGVAAVKYCKIWKEIFGEQKQPKRYGFPPKPKTTQALQRINCSFLQFVQNEGVDSLIPFFVYSQTVQGYGVLDKIPAFYGLYWNNPQLVLAPVWTALINHPAVFVLKQGFQHIFEKMAVNHKMNIIKNCQIQSVNRYLGDKQKKTKITYVSQKINEFAPHPDIVETKDYHVDMKDEIEIECDFLFLACGGRKSLAFLTDATDQEKKIFSALTPHTFCSTLYESATHVDNLHETVVEVWPKVQWNANGHLGAMRNSLKCWLGHDKYDELVKNGVITKDRSVTYQYEIREPSKDKQADSQYFKQKLLTDLDKWGEEDVRIIFQKVFDYHPIWSAQQINNGYPWIVKDEMQGKNKNTFYIGSSVSFESVLNVVEYNNEIFDQYLSS